jgi:hypothetical protein
MCMLCQLFLLPAAIASYSPDPHAVRWGGNEAINFQATLHKYIETEREAKAKTQVSVQMPPLAQ